MYFFFFFIWDKYLGTLVALRLKAWSFTNKSLSFLMVANNVFLIFRFFPLEKGSARSHPYYEVRGVTPTDAIVSYC